MRSRRNFLQLILSAPIASSIATLPYGLSFGDTALTRDLDTVRNRIQQMLVGDASRAVFAAAATLAPSLNANGLWPAIDYQDRSRSVWKTAVHLLNTLQLVAAYGTTKDVALKARLLPASTSALQSWIAHDPQNPNWWWNQIGAPRLLGEIALFLGDALPFAQRPVIESILKRADWTKWTGQNLVWGCQIQILRGLLTGSPDVVAQAFTRIYQELAIAPPTGEGIVPDFTFHQHGAQLYSGGYGLNFAADVGAYVCAAWGTAFQIPPDRLDVFTRYVLDGEAQMMRGSTFDYSACGREITREGKGMQWRGGIDVPASEAPLSGGIDLPVAARALGNLALPRQTEFAALTARLAGDVAATPLSGNRHFWCSDYMTHHRRNFFASVRMFSTRTINTEFVNEEGRKSHHLADGCTLIYRHGLEYRDVFPVWNWSKVPGTTAEQMDLSHAGTPVYKTDAAFVGGVSDRHYGAAAQDLRRDSLRARKAWFFCDEGFVALGAGVTCASQRAVATSVNQLLLHGDPVQAGHAIRHDGIAYVPLGETRFQMTAGPQTGRWSDIGTGSDTPVSLDVLNLWIDHGPTPHNDQYAYAILADVSANDIPRFIASPHLRILRNTPELQAVYLAGPRIVLAVFWSAGGLDHDGDHFAVNRPCLFMAQEGGRGIRIGVSNPLNEGGEITLTTSRRFKGAGAVSNSSGTIVKVALPDGPMAGSTVIAEFQTI